MNFSLIGRSLSRFYSLQIQGCSEVELLLTMVFGFELQGFGSIILHTPHYYFSLNQ